MNDFNPQNQNNNQGQDDNQQYEPFGQNPNPTFNNLNPSDGSAPSTSGVPGPASGMPTPPPSGMPTPPPTGMPTPPPAQEEEQLSNFKFGEIHQNFKTNIKIPAHNLTFDEQKFLRLLAGSISLTKDEKGKIIESIPKLTQYQIDELIRILEEERAKFIELSPKHGAQLEKLEKKHAEEWQDLEVQTQAVSKKQEDQSKADEIRKQLGL